MAESVTQHVLAKLLLDWGDLHRQLLVLEDTIQASVLGLGKTVLAGNVRARYSTGRKSFNPRAAVQALDPPVAPETLVLFTSVPKTPAPRVDWRGLAKALSLDVPYEQGEPSVRVMWEGD